MNVFDSLTRLTQSVSVRHRTIAVSFPRSLITRMISKEKFCFCHILSGGVLTDQYLFPVVIVSDYV